MKTEAQEILEGFDLFSTQAGKMKQFFFVVDGQFGSTGKGVATSLLARVSFPRAGLLSTHNAGPNSGHTSYYGSEKIVLTQLPTFGVQRHKECPFGDDVIYMNAGAVIDEDKLIEEVETHGVKVSVHPNAATVTETGKDVESNFLYGTTGKGTGFAIASKALREGRTAGESVKLAEHPSITVRRLTDREKSMGGLVEVSQGFSLGVNQRFYPYCTSRECTVMQAMSDAEIHPRDYGYAMAVYRTFPIRIAGNSGPGYEDQQEITWEDLGVEPEYTTVTKKMRRVFTWSWQQFEDSIRVNQPEFLFLNFCNYLTKEQAELHAHEMRHRYMMLLGRPPLAILMGWGPYAEDITLFDR